MQQTYATGFETTFTTPFGMDANHPPTHSDSGPEPLRGKNKLQINLYLSQKKEDCTNNHQYWKQALP